MTQAHEVANIIGYLGNLAALVLFLSPIESVFVRIIKEKSVKEFSCMAYVVTLLNCLLWVVYGSRKGVILIMTINGAGVLIQSIYTAIFLGYAFNSKRKEFWKVFSVLALELVFLAVLVLAVRLGVSAKHTQITIFGIFCVIGNIGFCYAPLTIMRTVISTRSVEFMPLPLTLMTVLNCVLWIIYASLQDNVFVLIPNVVGLVGGIFQVVLYFWFFKTPESIAAKEGKPDTFVTRALKLVFGCCLSSGSNGKSKTVELQQTTVLPPV